MSDAHTTPQNALAGATIVEMSFDGGCRHNPNGEASSAAVVRDQEGRTLRHVGLAIGIASNNVAEWRALQLGLETARALGAAGVRAYGDSKLVAEQFAGRYAIHESRLRAIALDVSRLAQRFPAGVTLTWIPRESNRAADAICTAVLNGTYVADSTLEPSEKEPTEPGSERDSVEVAFLCTVRMDAARARDARRRGVTVKALRSQLAAAAETRLLLASKIGELTIEPQRVRG